MSHNLHDKPSINVLFCGSTDISRLNSLSSAGKDPESTFLTPTVDAEIIQTGKVISTDEPPMTPDGIPTPSIIASSALDAMEIQSLIVNAGLKFKPKASYYETGLEPAKAGNMEVALPEIKSALSAGRDIFRLLKNCKGPIMMSESVPGGTTTAQMVMNLWGKEFKSSSSMKHNPVDLKERICKEVVKHHGIQSDPIKAVRLGGDYMQAITLSFLSNVDDEIVYLAGGTQMAVVWYIASELGYHMDNVYLCTTDLVMKDSADQIEGIVNPDHIIVSRLNYKLSEYKGIQLYADDNVREGAGLGGSTYFALQTMDDKSLMKRVDGFYSKFIHP